MPLLFEHEAQGGMHVVGKVGGPPIVSCYAIPKRCSQGAAEATPQRVRRTEDPGASHVDGHLELRDHGPHHLLLGCCGLRFGEGREG